MPVTATWCWCTTRRDPACTAMIWRRLIERAGRDPAGGLLAVPVGDTLKRGVKGNRVGDTVPREGLWRALTPQLFRYGVCCVAR